MLVGKTDNIMKDQLRNIAIALGDLEYKINQLQDIIRDMRYKEMKLINPVVAVS